MNSNNELLREIHGALTVAIAEWETPDSPEGFSYAMKHLMNIRERISSVLKIKTSNHCGNKPSVR